MKIVVMGGAGRVGAGLSQILVNQGHAVTAASRRTGVNVLTGEGLPQVLLGADVVVDVLNSPSFDDETALSFFETSTRRLLDLEAEAGVKHHVALSIVGAERLARNGYFRAKLSQELQVEGAGLPFSILRATQFFEFLDAIVDDVGGRDEVRVAPARVQPIAAADVAFALAQIAVSRPTHAIVEVAGPEAWRLDEIVRSFLSAKGDPRPVVPDPDALYFGTSLNDETLMAGSVPRFGHTEFDAWLRRWVREHSPALATAVS